MGIQEKGQMGQGKVMSLFLNILSLRCQLATQVDISPGHLGINGLKHGSRIDHAYFITVCLLSHFQGQILILLTVTVSLTVLHYIIFK